MKVLQVNKLYYPHIGGVENHVRVLATGLKDKIDVEVLVANEQSKMVVEFIDGVRVTKVASIGRLRSAPIAPGFMAQLRKIKSDIYHFHFPNPTGETAFLLARPQGKLVVTYHSDIVRQKMLLKFYRPFLEKFLNRADRIIVSSPNLIESSPFLKKVRGKCRVIPFGISADWLMLTPEVEERVDEIRRTYGPKIAFFLGRLIYYKGIDYLIRAMQDVRGKLIIAGDGELGSELKRLASDLRVKDRVRFIGTLSDKELSSYYHACDIFVLPSVESSEAYGLVQLEAHACGKPVVSTNLPTGVPFVNRDGVSGLIVPTRDSKALSEAINELFDNDELRVRLGNQAKERFERGFTSEAMIERVLETYGEVLGE
ncbi:MAG: glycosyltransferase [Actinobacteria bacterium]|nr:glycosyltransferase [Actinomycetota bacterium]